VIDVSSIPISRVEWRGAVRIVRSVYPPIDLFEDIADPVDWPQLISAEQKTNPRLMETIAISTCCRRRAESEEWGRAT